MHYLLKARTRGIVSLSPLPPPGPALWHHCMRPQAPALGKYNWEFNWNMNESVHVIQWFNACMFIQLFAIHFFLSLLLLYLTLLLVAVVTRSQSLGSRSQRQRPVCQTDQREQQVSGVWCTQVRWGLVTLSVWTSVFLVTNMRHWSDKCVSSFRRRDLFSEGVSIWLDRMRILTWWPQGAPPPPLCCQRRMRTSLSTQLALLTAWAPPWPPPASPRPLPPCRGGAAGPGQGRALGQEKTHLSHVCLQISGHDAVNCSKIRILKAFVVFL